MLLKEFIVSAKQSLSDIYKEEEANAIVLNLCQELLGTKNYTHIVDPGYVIEKKKRTVLNESLERLKNNEPIQYVLGIAEFFGRKFKVSPSVLIPRQETETLCKLAVDEAMRLKRQRSPYGAAAEKVRVLDLCTGSGCIAWTLALSVPGSEVFGVDISEEALEVAKSNSFLTERKESGANQVKFIQADILGEQLEEEFFKDEKQFDLILSNPPYVRNSEKELMKKNVLDFEPHLALFVEDEDPLVYYEAVAKRANKLLSESGIGIVEINEAFAEPVANIFKENQWVSTEVIKDIYGKNRFVIFSK